MTLSESRIVVLDVVASAASGMPVYYPIPETAEADDELAKIGLLRIRPKATTDSLTPLKRLQAFIQTHLMTTRKTMAPREPRRRRVV